MHRSPRLRVVEPIELDLPNGRTLLALPGVPATRAECPQTSRDQPCPFIGCRHHLYTECGEDRPGRRHDGKPPPSTLRLDLWERDDLPPSCALDVADAMPAGIPAREIAPLLGLESRRRVEQITKSALAKLRALGVDLPDPDELEGSHAPNLAFAGAF